MLLEAGAELTAGTRGLIGRRIGSAPRTTETSYSLDEFKAIKSAAHRVVNNTAHRIGQTAELIRRFSAGDLPAGSVENEAGRLLSMLLDGSLTRDRVDRATWDRLRAEMGIRGIRDLTRMLFPDSAETFAAAVLLVCYQGWNHGVIHSMKCPERRPDGSAGGSPIYTVTLHKPRRGSSGQYMTNNLVDSGRRSPGGVLTQILAITEQVRIAATAADIDSTRLMIYAGPPNRDGVPLFTGVDYRVGVVARFTDIADLTDAAGAPLHVSLRRLRRTVQVLHRSPRQNTDTTHESAYVLADRNARGDTQDIVADGLREAIEHAQAQLQARWIGPTTDRPSHIDDTAVCGCADYHSSPFTDPGQACTASFLLCFACPNAVAERRHLPRLVTLLDALERMRSAVDADAWQNDWMPHWARLSTLLRDNTTADERDHARQTATDHDRELVAALIERRLDAP
ncbi:hypothetical protein QRB41_27320 [Mycobacterium avium subsp. hominissuis]|nr:hypothetical protein [Mycobacterium avium]MDO2387028.1 hypothetical protein [Mycobacterium avium subsp. hominissuis]